MAISDWPVSERPRERMLALGASHLSDAELLAVWLRTGVRGKSAVELARELLARCGGVAGLLAADHKSLRTIKGLGDAKLAQLSAVVELARRALAGELRAGSVLASPQAVRDYLRLSLGGRPHEVFVALYLDAQHRVSRWTNCSGAPHADQRLSARSGQLRWPQCAALFALTIPAASPSRARPRVAHRSLKDALGLVDVKVLDHFIVAGNRTLSFAERGLL